MQTRFESVYLMDLIGPPGEVPLHIARRFGFYGDLARFGSARESGPEWRTPVRCRLRPGRKPCTGLIVVRRRDLPAAVEWRCPDCAARGQISGWEETAADLRALDFAPLLGSVEVAVTIQAHAALREAAWLDFMLVPLAYLAGVDGRADRALLFSDDASRDGRAVMRHALSEDNRRRRGLLVDIADGLMHAGGAQRSGFIELDAEVGAAFLDSLLELSVGEPLGSAPLRGAQRGPAAGTAQIKVTLRDVCPPVWRRLVVPSDIRLSVLHEVLQGAMGWHDSHLHAFRVGDRLIAPPDDDSDPVWEDSRLVTLNQVAPGPRSRLAYEYDFGDGWCHDIEVEEVGPECCGAARCLKGRRSCPPEDCGGPEGYATLCDALADPDHEEHREVLEWLPAGFDPEAFDVVAADVRLSRIPL